MSPRLSAASEPPPDWLAVVLGCGLPPEGGTANIGGGRFVMRGGILRQEALASAAQAQTASTFGHKWQRRETYDSGVMQAALGAWLRERYGDPDAMPFLAGGSPPPVMLDAGCGSGMSALELFGPRLARTRYLGADISSAVDVARTRFAERGVPGRFLQCDLMHVPLPEASVDIVFSEGVLHHTDSTEAAIGSLARLIKPGGRFLFYWYAPKNAHRQSIEEVRAWCAEAGLVIERERVEDAGITIDARKAGDARKVGR